MKKNFISIIIYIASSIPFLSGCSSSAKSEENDDNRVENANEDLFKAQVDADSIKQKANRDEEWIAFRDKSDEKVKKNEELIEQLIKERRELGKKMDDNYHNKIEVLNIKNRKVKSIMDSFKQDEENWEAFKHEVDQEILEIDRSLKDITARNKK
jgi:hypothetical protein